jgi:hypothetical protein
LRPEGDRGGCFRRGADRSAAAAAADLAADGAFGLVNGGYSSMVAWLAPYYQAQDWAAAESGSLVAVMAAFQAAAALVVPILAARSRDRRHWLIATLAMQAITVVLYLRLDPTRYAEAMDLTGRGAIHLECGAVRGEARSPA